MPTISGTDGDRQVAEVAGAQPHGILLGRQHDRRARPRAPRRRCASTSRGVERDGDRETPASPAIVPAGRREMSAKNRSGRAMPATTNTRESGGTTTESRAPAIMRGAPIVRVTRNTVGDAERAADALRRRVVAGGRRARHRRRPRRASGSRSRPRRQRRDPSDRPRATSSRSTSRASSKMLKPIVEQVDGGAEPAFGERGRTR